MQFVIINASPRIASKSNTELILDSFCKGFASDGSTWELRHLSNRAEWQNARDGIAANTHILIALPLYVENVPGICPHRRLSPGICRSLRGTGPYSYGTNLQI
jgi:hypothetical protein